jgi:hypothetical protein
MSAWTRSTEADSPVWPRLTVATLALAVLLRLSLIWGGGQAYWPDETRYLAARSAVINISRGEIKAGCLELIGTADHLFFKIIALPPALLDQWLGVSVRREAAYFSLFSVLAIALLGKCARTAGASRREAWLAVFLATCSNSLFYYSRHLFPYDVSLAIFMVSLALGLRPASPRISFIVGVVAGLGFLTYVGYWLLGGAILVLHVLKAPSMRAAELRAAAAAAGLALPIALAVIAARELGGDLVASFRSFSTTVFQGDFGRGHAFVWQYLWSAEGVMLIFWILAGAYSLIMGRRQRFSSPPWSWLGMAAALYLGLVVFSDIHPTFVVYGRTARMLTPFACLLAAWGANDFWARAKLRDGQAFAGLALIGSAAALNFASPFAITFTPQFMSEGAKLVAASKPGLFHYENAHWMRPGETADDGSRPGETLLTRRHPLQFEAYLFEGYNEAQRAYLTSHDIRMKLKSMAIPAPPNLMGYPGPVRLRIRFTENHPGASDPLVEAGAGDSACLLFVTYVDAGTVSFGFESRNKAALMGSPAAIDYGRDHDLVISEGPLLPGGTLAPYQPLTPGAWDKLRHSILVILDGRVVLAGSMENRESPISEIKMGVNQGGLPSVEPVLESAVASVSAVAPAEILGRLSENPAGP